MLEYYYSFLQTHFAVTVLSVCIIALMVGSFLNVVIYRLPMMMMQDWRAQCCELLNIPQNDHVENSTTIPTHRAAHSHPIFNFSLPRSHCPHCSHQLFWWQNIPLISYVLLKGRCHFCKKAISPRYPLVELLSVISSAFLIWRFGMTLQFVAAALLTWILLILIFIDLAEKILPDTLTLSLLWVGLFCNIRHLFTNINSAVIGAIVGYLFLWIIAWLFHKITGKQGLGLGDCKLLAALGAWTGWQMLPLIVLLASLLGSIVGLSLILLKKSNRDTPISFGPYLALAGWIGLLWGTQIMQWYIMLY